MAGHRAKMDAWRQGWGRNCLCKFQPDLVYLLERHRHRSLLSDGGPATAPDLQYLITDSKSFFHEEKRHLESKLEHLSDHGLGYRYTNSDPAGHYAIVREIIVDPHLACVLQRTKVTGDESFVSKLHLVTLGAATAGPTWPAIFKWTGSSIARPMATSHSREN